MRRPTKSLLIEKLVSGGQTGVDRAALDVALKLSIPCGGWCPRGRRAEDGEIPARYPLEETRSREYRARTLKNLTESGATLVLTRGEPKGGTKLTVELAEAGGKPVLVVDLSSPPAPRAVIRWLEAHGVRILNVAGPRESQAPGIYEEARAYLLRLWRRRRGREESGPRNP